jgi:hypothetical protein
MARLLGRYSLWVQRSDGLIQPSQSWKISCFSRHEANSCVSRIKLWHASWRWEGTAPLVVGDIYYAIREDTDLAEKTSNIKKDISLIECSTERYIRCGDFLSCFQLISWEAKRIRNTQGSTRRHRYKTEDHKFRIVLAQNLQ